MAKARRGYHHGDLRAAIVKAALASIRESGAPVFAMREIAERVGVTHPAMYRHFEDKRALLAAIAVEGYALLDAAMKEPLAARTREARLLAFARAYVAFARAHEGHFRVMFGPRLNRDGRFPELEAAVSTAYAALFEAMGGEAHGARASHDRAFAAWSLVQGYASLLCDGRIPLRRARADAASAASAADAHVTRLAQLLAPGLRAPRAPSGRAPKRAPRRP